MISDAAGAAWRFRIGANGASVIVTVLVSLATVAVTSAVVVVVVSSMIVLGIRQKTLDQIN